MKKLKHPSLLLVCLIILPACLIYFAYPFLDNHATEQSEQLIAEEQNQIPLKQSFRDENNLTFVDELGAWVYAAYTNYKNDGITPYYESMLSNYKELTLDEKDAFHSLVVQNFQQRNNLPRFYLKENDTNNYRTSDETLVKYTDSYYYNSDDSFWFIVLVFNENGEVSIKSSSNSNLKSAVASSIEKNAPTFTNFPNFNISSEQDNIKLNPIKNLTMVFEVQDGEKIGVQVASDYQTNNTGYHQPAYLNENYRFFFLTLLMLVSGGTALFLKKEKVEDCFIYQKGQTICLEIPAFLLFFFGLFAYFSPASYVYSGFVIVYFPIFIAIFGSAVWLIFFLKNAHGNFIEAYNNYSFFRDGGENVKRFWHNFLQYISMINFSNEHYIQALIITAINFLVLIFSMVFGIPFLLLYSICFFFLIILRGRKQRSDFQTLKAVLNKFSTGQYNEPLENDLGCYEALKDDLVNIQEGIKEAVAQEITSQRMKNELITNVSHDLKTPLTSIISYIDLLKDENLKKEDQQKYILTLEKSADRLKHLIEDLFEVSKANSGNVSLEYMEIDLISLLKQVELECKNAFDKKNLTVKHSFSDEKILVCLDSQKAYRIFENLMSNVGKYALSNTRVYIHVTDFDSRVDVEIKNVSEAELNFTPDEIIERFTRGDKSRNTEGSGLGLAIAKSFTELLQGSMRIDLDGDIFKVLLSFYKHPKEEA